MKHKVVKYLLCGASCAGVIALGFTTVSAAQSKTTRSQLASKGIVEIYDQETDSTTLLDSSDLEYLADTIDGISSELSSLSGESNSVVITDADGRLTTGSVSSDELSSLSGVSSNVQTQLVDLADRLNSFQNQVDRLTVTVDNLDGSADGTLSSFKLESNLANLTEAFESLKDTTASASDIVEGKVAWLNGGYTKGTMSSYANATIEIGKGAVYVTGAANNDLNKKTTYDSVLVTANGSDHTNVVVPFTGYTDGSTVISIDNNVLIASNENIATQTYVRDVVLNTSSWSSESDVFTIAESSFIKYVAGNDSQSSLIEVHYDDSNVKIVGCSGVSYIQEEGVVKCKFRYKPVDESGNPVNVRISYVRIVNGK